MCKTICRILRVKLPDYTKFMERPQKYFCIIVKRQRKNLPSSLVVLQYLYLAAGQASLKVYCLILRGEGGGGREKKTGHLNILKSSLLSKLGSGHQSIMEIEQEVLSFLPHGD